MKLILGESLFAWT